MRNDHERIAAALAFHRVYQDGVQLQAVASRVGDRFLLRKVDPLEERVRIGEPHGLRVATQQVELEGVLRRIRNGRNGCLARIAVYRADYRSRLRGLSGRLALQDRCRRPLRIDTPVAEPVDRGVVQPDEVDDVPQVLGQDFTSLSAGGRRHVEAPGARVVDIDAADVNDPFAIRRKRERAELADRAHLGLHPGAGPFDDVDVARRVRVIDERRRRQRNGIAAAIGRPGEIGCRATQLVRFRSERFQVEHPDPGRQHRLFVDDRPEPLFLQFLELRRWRVRRRESNAAAVR